MSRSAKRDVILLLGYLVFFGAAGLSTGCKEVGARRAIQEGNKLYYASKYDDAVQKYNEALAAEPQLAIGWFNLGLAHLANFAPGMKTEENDKHAKGAIDAFATYLKMVPTDVQAQDYMLGVYIDSGRYEGAIRFFEMRLEKNPNDVEAVAQLAHISTQAAAYDEAIKWHKRRAEMVQTPDLKADSWYSIGVLDWKRLNAHPEVMEKERARIADEGIGWLQQADKVRPNHSATLSYINLLYRERALAHATSYARVIDATSAQVFYKRAADAAKKQ